MRPFRACRTKSLLQVDQHFTVGPKRFELVIIALVRGKNVNDHIPIIGEQPSVLRFAFDIRPPIVTIFHMLPDRLRQGVEHTLARP